MYKKTLNLAVEEKLLICYHEEKAENEAAEKRSLS